MGGLWSRPETFRNSGVAMLWPCMFRWTKSKK